jgi:hypothetical protein
MRIGRYERAADDDTPAALGAHAALVQPTEQVFVLQGFS